MYLKMKHYKRNIQISYKISILIINFIKKYARRGVRTLASFDSGS